MLEKDKNCIEFSMRSMMATHKPYQEDTEIAIKGMAPGKNLLLANNPFDIPCDVVVVSKSYFDRLQTENEQLKKKLTTIQTSYALNEFDPIPEFKELLKKLYSTDDVKDLEWVLKHTCGGMASANGWRAVSSFWKDRYETFSNDLKEWKEATGCPSPSSAKTLIESGASWCHAYHESKAVNKKFADSIKAWQNVTGCSTPEEAKNQINELGAVNETLANQLISWEKITGFSTPEKCSSYIDTLEKKLEDIKDLIGED